MDLNKLLEALTAHTAALEAHTAALTGIKTAVAAGTKPAAAAAGKPGPKPKGPTREEMIAKINEVKEKLGSDAAKEIISGTGSAKLAQIPDNKIAEAFKAAVDALEAPAPEPESEDDGL